MVCLAVLVHAHVDGGVLFFEPNESTSRATAALPGSGMEGILLWKGFQLL